MKSLSLLGGSLLFSLWVSAIAILAVQNAEPISLRFLGFQSIQFPIGLILALSATAGILGGALIQILELSTKETRSSTTADNFSDEIDF